MDDQQPSRRLQFTLRKLLLWTGVWAIYLGIVRATGMGLTVAGLLTLYLAFLLMVRLRYGFERGLSNAILVTGIAIVFVISTTSKEPLSHVLVMIGFFCAVGFLAVPIIFVWVHLLVAAVDWLDGLMQRRN